MRLKKVLCTRVLPEPGLRLLRQRVDLSVHEENRPMSRQELIERIQDKDGLICLLSDNIDKPVFDAAPHLKIAANYAVGYNNIDIATATERGIPVTNTPDVLTQTTADLAFALILSCARRIVEADRFMRDGQFNGWEPMLMLGQDVHDKTIGIIGFGRIGQAVAQRAQGFNMRILCNDIEPVPEKRARRYKAEFTTLKKLLSQSDYVCLHVPLTKETRHLMSDKEFSIMKNTAYLINVSRGPVVDEKALVRALKKKKIAGTALDVYENEPHCERELIDMKNTVLVPHIGSASVETRTHMALMVAHDVIAVLNKDLKPEHVVNPDYCQ
jgi:glyoxylate reductase